MKKITLILLLFFTTIYLKSEEVNIDMAKKVAQNAFFVMSEKSRTQKSFKEDSISEKLIYTTNNKKTLYIFNFINGGYIILPIDDRFKTVIAYSQKGHFDTAKNSPGLNLIIKSYSNQIAYDSINTNFKNSDWTRFEGNANFISYSTASSVSPLIKTYWDQSFNNFCPIDNSSNYNNRCVAGCVPLAMGQVMNYYKYPLFGSGNHSYTHPIYGPLYADFKKEVNINGLPAYEQLVDWNSVCYKFPCSYAAKSSTEISKLLYYCGVSVEADYGPKATSASPYCAVNALVQYFRYDRFASVIFSNDYSYEDWISILKNELLLNRPIIYTGNDNYSGHTFIVDGFKDNNLFHINWGWGGDEDGYFTLGDLTPGSYIFNYGQYAIINLKPSVDANIILPQENSNSFFQFYSTNGTITSTDIIQNNSNKKVIYSAKNGVTLNAGFQASGPFEVNLLGSSNSNGIFDCYYGLPASKSKT